MDDPIKSVICYNIVGEIPNYMYEKWVMDVGRIQVIFSGQSPKYDFYLFIKHNMVDVGKSFIFF